MNDTVKICALGIMCALLFVVLKNYSSGFVLPGRVAGTIILFGLIITISEPLLKYLKELSGGAFSVEYLSLILKAISIAYITQITSEICRDCDEGALANGIDTIGKIEILVLSLPLIEEIINVSRELSSW